MFSEAEIAGEIMRAKLGTKLASATNDCELDIIAGDKLTQDILREDEEMATEAARVYFAFVQLMEKMREKRLNKLSNGKPPGKWTPEELGASPDFMLSMKVRYHGAKLQENGFEMGTITRSRRLSF